MSIQRVFGGSGNFLTALPGDAFGEIVSHLEKRDVETLMYISKQVAEKWLNAEHGWRSFLPDRYRHVANPVSIVKESWIQKRDIERSAAHHNCDFGWGPHGPVIAVNVISEVMNRIISLSPWETRHPENTLTPSEIAEWSAIEMLFNDAIKRYEAGNTRDPGAVTYCDMLHIKMLTLVARDYLSQKLVSELGRRSDLKEVI